MQNDSPVKRAAGNDEIIASCLENAENLLAAAKENASNPRRRHIAFHLAALALEEIGKSSMIFMSSLREVVEDEGRSPGHWIEDHERKLFWAFWSPQFDKQLPWDGIRDAMDFARQVHEARLSTLYVNPNDPDARSRLNPDMLERVLNFAEAQLALEKSKKPRSLTDEQRADVDWFFSSTKDPQLSAMIFSKGSLEKQAELPGDPGAWIRWLRTTIEDWNRESRELTQRELNRVPPSNEEGDEDKWEMKIRLKSGSHSIRPKAFALWNKEIEKIKLHTTSDRREILATFIMQRRLKADMVWWGGMQSSMLLVLSLNIATKGFFWWYLPTFISKFAESVIDLENQGAKVEISRNPALTVSWGNLALQATDMAAVSQVMAHIISLPTEEQRAPYMRYFRALALMAKNDIFFQFEANMLIDFSSVLREAMVSQGDWDGKEETLDKSTDAAFPQSAGDLVAMIKDLTQVASLSARGENKSRPITLEDAVKMKVACDFYLHLKAAAYIKTEIANKKGQSGTTA